MTDITEFIVESVDESDEVWELFNTTYKLDDEDQDPHARFAKKFTSMATTATIFRWKFGDQNNNPTIETTLNPYIHRFHGPGSYSVSHQSCAPCLYMDPPLICSNGWCTKDVVVEEAKEQGDSSLVALAGLAGLFIIAREDNCCKLRDMCSEKREICKSIKPGDTENTKECKTIEKSCTTRLKDCKKKCSEAGHMWKPLPYTCLEKNEPHKEICQTIERQKYVEKKKKY